jgi:hypothetical protein
MKSILNEDQDNASLNTSLVFPMTEVQAQLHQDNASLNTSLMFPMTEVQAQLHQATVHLLCDFLYTHMLK